MYSLYANINIFIHTHTHTHMHTCIHKQTVIAGFAISSLRQLYFEIKDKVFGKGMLNYLTCDTEALEEILKRVFGDRKMTETPHGTKWEFVWVCECACVCIGMFMCNICHGSNYIHI